MAARVRERGGKNGSKSLGARRYEWRQESGSKEVRMAARVRKREGKNSGKSLGARR